MYPPKRCHFCDGMCQCGIYCVISRESILIWRQLHIESEVAQSCLTLCYRVEYSPPGSSVRGIFEARILEWVAISFSRGSSQPRDRSQVSRIAGRCFNLWAIREALLHIEIVYNLQSNLLLLLLLTIEREEIKKEEKEISFFWQYLSLKQG